jgi:NHL repeat
MMKAYRRVRNLEPPWRFCFPTAVDFNPATDEIIVADSHRNRLQVTARCATICRCAAGL